MKSYPLVVLMVVAILASLAGAHRLLSTYAPAESPQAWLSWRLNLCQQLDGDNATLIARCSPQTNGLTFNPGYGAYVQCWFDPATYWETHAEVCN